jgi:hypothetical protein
MNQQSVSQPAELELLSEKSPISFWSLTIGSILTVLATIAGSYARFILHTTRLDQNHLSVAAVFPLVLITLLLARPLKLSRGELIVIFSMSLIGATMPTYFIGKLIANFAVPYYLSSPENQWRDYFEPELATYTVVPEGNALRWFFEGLPTGTAVPWLAWTTPVFWWMSVIAAFYGCCLFLMVMLRRQWVENERIDFPLMEMPLAILEEPEEGGYFRLPILNRSLFWFGFGISLFVILWNIISYFHPTFPTIPWRFNDIKFGPEFPAIGTRLYWMVVGFGYFINLDISFSLWFFNLLTNIEVGMFNRIGLDIGKDEEYSTTPLVMGVQSMGAFFVIVGASLWMARSHLSGVYRKAIYDDPAIDDSDEIVSYRTAFFGFIICATYLFVWHVSTGMEIRYVPIFLIGALIMYLGITRVIAETGLISIRAPLMPQPFAMFITGSDTLTRETMVSIALSYSWCSDTKTTIMPALAHSTKLYSTIRHHQRQMIIGVVLAMAVGVLASFIYTIYMGYLHGAANYGGIFTGGLARYPWDNLVKKVKGPFSTKWGPLGFMFSGAVATAGLMALRYRFPAWPLHPIGFAAGPVYPVNRMVFPLFLAWAIKSTILRVGGVGAYRAGRPFFIGLILGHFVGAGISFIVDMIWFHGNGHSIPFSD